MIINTKKYLTNGSITHNKSFYLKTVESKIALELEKIQNKFIKKVNIGSYPFFKDGKVGVCIVVSSIFMKEINLCAKYINKMALKKKIILLSD